MSVTSYKACATCADDATVGTVSWVTNAGGTLAGTEESADDNAYGNAGTSSGDTTHYLKCTMGANAFSTSDIPSGATIDGFEIEVIRQRNGSPVVTTNLIKLVKGGSIVGNDFGNSTDWSDAVEQTVTLGSSSQKGGQSWSDSDARSSSLGCVIAATVGTARIIANPNLLIDRVRIRVYYTTGGTDVTVTPGVVGDATGTMPTPSVSAGCTVTVGLIGSVAGALLSPSVLLGATIAAAAMACTADLLTTSVVFGSTMQAPVGTATLAMDQPSVNGGIDIQAPLVGSVAGDQPAASISGGATLTPLVVGNVSGQTYTPSILTDQIISLSLVGNATGDLLDPNVTTDGNLTLTPDVIGSATGDLLAPQINLDYVVTVASFAGTCTMLAPTIKFGSTISVALIGAGTGTLLGVSISLGAGIDAPLSVGTCTMASPGVSGDANAVAGVSVGSCTMLTPTVIVGDSVMIIPSTFGCTGDLLSPVISIDKVVLIPGVMDGTAVFWTPTPLVGSTIAAAVATGSAALVAPSYVGPNLTPNAWWFRQYVVRRRR
jgi:hypothetical protein